MRGKRVAAGVLAVASILGWSSVSRAGDTIRLNGVTQAPTMNLVDDGQGADTVRTWHHGYGWGGYRGFGWGGYRGFGLGYGGFYRPYYGFGLGYGGLYRPFGLGYGGFYRPFGLGYGLGFGGLGYGLGGYRFGYGGFYPGFGIGYGGLWGPCAGAPAGDYNLTLPSTVAGTPLPGAPAASLPAAPAATPLPGAPAPAQQALPGEETFPYDGGPSSATPQMKHTQPPQRSVPLEGRSVSLPRATPKWAFPAYGETARRITPASERTYLTRGESKNPNAR